MARRDVASGPVVPDNASAVTPPIIDDDGVPNKCLSFTIRSDWGHFRRIDRTVTKQTYRLPPRTTIAGMLAAMTGCGRDSYYEIFGPETSAIAIQQIGQLRTVTEPMLGLSTNPDEHFTHAGGTGRKTVQVRYPDSTLNRQLHSYELLVDPAYRIDVAVEDEAFYRALAHRLQTGTSYYPLSMGLSEHLAWIDCPSEGDSVPEIDVERIQADGSLQIDSVLPEGAGAVVPRSDVSTHVERMPAFMEADEDGRRTTGFKEYTFTTNNQPLEIRTDGLSPAMVNDRTVVFG